jgi:S1-C subfamily serine protease
MHEWQILGRLARLIGCAFCLSILSPSVLAGSDLTLDHREALERGCQRQSAGNRLTYHTCMQNALDQFERGRKLANVEALPPAVREQIRLACIGKKDLGLFEYDDCIRSQLPRQLESGQPAEPRRVEGSAVSPETGEALSPARLFELTSSSVYFVDAHSDGSTYASIGSAVAVSDTLMLTNCHIIAQAQEVLISETKSASWTASLRYADRKTDRCVLESSRRVMPIAGTRAYADLKVGERVYTIGNPSGLTRTLAEGLISGLRMRDGVRLVQTSAAISPGSSGGGLFDSRGRLVGITTFIIGERSMLGFAIAADEFTSLLPLGR